MDLKLAAPTVHHSKTVYYIHHCNTDHHDKWATPWQTNKVSVRPAKTQISLGIRPVRSESLLSAWRKLGHLATHGAHSEESESSLGAQSHCWFCHEAAQMLSEYSRFQLLCTLTNSFLSKTVYGWPRSGHRSDESKLTPFKILNKSEVL